MTHSVMTPTSEQPADPQIFGSETDRLDPPVDSVTLSTGTQIRVLPLKMRQLFRLMRIVTRGGAAYLPMLRDVLMTDSENTADAFGAQLLAIALIALPEAEDEAVEFVLSVVEPCDLLTRSDKQSREHNDRLRTALSEELYNPDPGDLVTILEAVVNREKGDLVALGKRLGAMFNIAVKTGQIDPEVTKTLQASIEQIPESPGPLHDPSISYRQSTDGQTPYSSTSTSVE